MRRIGRNEPCPCGSGKKYKRCCLGREEAREAFARIVRRRAVPLLDELAKFARQAAPAPLEAMARREFPFWQGPIDKGRAARVLDYLMFDYRPESSGRRTIDEFAIQHGPALAHEQRALLEGWAQTMTRPYAVEDWSGGFVRCRDLLAESAAAIEVMPLPAHTVIAKDRVIGLRALPLESGHVSVTEPLQFGKRSAQDVVGAIRGRHLDYVRRRRIVGIDDFLRVESKEIDEEAARAGRPSGIIIAGTR